MKRIELEQLKRQHRALRNDYKILYQDYVNACRSNKKLMEENACLKLRVGDLQKLRVQDNKEK